MKQRNAMTLIEVLVVLAILASLFGLFLGALQRVRDVAARAQCASQLRQLGLACLLYHDAHRVFPPGYRDCRCTDPMMTSPGWGWATQMLPYLEQQALFDRILFHHPIEDPRNEARRIRVGIYLCPADANVPLTFPITNAAGQLITEAAPISYAACLGSGELDEIPGPKEGVFYRNSHIRIGDITDGTSSTILLGDRAWSHAMAPWAGAVNGGIVRGGPRNPWRNSPEAAYPAPNFCCVQANAINKAKDPDGSLDEFFSGHWGGVNLLFADGGVRFVHQEINPIVLMALGTRAGGEVVNEADY
jgi:prepilin-type N-terminal cleavage/methylation domain-containing protein/prepilin-type processing-associated H-X9-DG protein